MSEADPPAGEEFGVQLQWPRGGVLPADVAPPATTDPAPAPDDSALGHEQQPEVTAMRRLLDDHLGRRSDELARMSGVLKHLRAGIDDAAASLHRLAASTAALSSEVTDLVEMARRNATQTASLVSLTEALSHRVDEGLGAVRADIAQVAGEVSAVRRRLPVAGRDAAAHR